MVPSPCPEMHGSVDMPRESSDPVWEGRYSLTKRSHPAVVDTRAALPGVITVTPVPIEQPIHTRPVIIQSHSPGVTVNATFPFIATKPPSRDTFHWGLFILLVLLAALLGVILSKWGWTKITGRIWKLSSGWEGPLELDDEDPLLEDSAQTSKDTTAVTQTEVSSPSTDYGAEQTSVEDWIVTQSKRLGTQES